MKIIDCFLYNNEELILDIRINTLTRYVDKFVIVESKFDHQGNKKKLNFNIDNFKKFKDKIKYLVIEEFPDGMTNWDRENYQRNYIIHGIRDLDEDDYIIISDVDEIPDLNKLKNLHEHKFTVFKQKLFYYKLNLQNETTPFWFGSKICKKKYLKSPQWLREIKIKKNQNFFKRMFFNPQILKQGGWHFTYIKKPLEIITKLKSFAHNELVKEHMLNEDYIKNKINNNLDLFDRDMVFKKIDLENENFPNYLIENKEKFKDFIT